MKSLFRVILLSLAFVFTFTTCENPVGLGSKVNTEKPVIKNAGEENQPGSYVQGDGNRIWLDVEQEFGITRVFMEVEYINKYTGEVERRTIEAYYDEERKQWYVDLDTSDMQDGTIKAWVTAIDINGNSTTTTDIIYYVKNTPPQVKLNMPLVDGNNWDDDDFLKNIVNNDPLFLGFELMGLATDNYGIAEGYPKIMIWPSDAYVDLDDDEIPLPDGINGGLYGTWRSLVVPNARDGLTATKFTWPMMNLIADASAEGGYRLPKGNEGSTALNTGFYRIRIVIEDLFGNQNFYPNRSDHGDKKSSKKYIEINYKASDVPIIQVTNYPQYFNAVKDFELFFSVSSKNDPTSVSASIVDTNDETTETVLGGPYTPEFLTKDIVYKYKLTIPAADAKAWKNNNENGIKYVKLRAIAGDSVGPNAYQNFIFDNTPPDVVIDRPVSLQDGSSLYASGKLEGGAYEIRYPYADGRPKWVTGTIQVGGSANDELTLIKKVYYHIGKLGDDTPTANREGIYNLLTWTDTKLDSPTHDANWTGSLYSWTYKFDPFPKNYKTTYTDVVQLLSQLDNYPNTDYSATDIPDKTRFYLPFYVKVVDSADNFKIIHYKLCVDPDLDDPVITFTQPDNNSTVGGTVRIGGMAEDNFWMKTVLIRVKKTGVYQNSPTLTTNGYYLPPGKTQFYSANPTYPKPADYEGYFETTLIGDSANVNWWVNINQDLALDPATSGTTADVLIQAVAIDCAETDTLHNTPHIIGPVEPLNLKFSKDVPKITNPVISRAQMVDVDYTESVKTSGTFAISFDVKAIEGINSLTVRINGAATPVKLIDNSMLQSVTSWTISNRPADSGFTVRNVKVDINSENGGVIPALPYGTSSQLTLEVEAVDNTTNHLKSTSTFTIGIDNFYPQAVIQTSKVASEDIPNGKLFYIEGQAKDYATGSGPVQGLERVLVCFEHAKIDYPSGTRTITGNGNYVRPKGGGTLIPSNFESYHYVLDYGVSTTPTLLKWNTFEYMYFPKHSEKVFNDKTIWTSDVALVIDYPDAGDADVDGDGTLGESWAGTTADRDWAGRVEFTGWKDGPYIVHYFIMDQAANVSHYTSDFYLENNKPRITSINFGTDINGVGGVTDGTNSTLNEYLYSSNAELTRPGTSLLYGVQTPSFRIRNNAFSVKLEVEKGNGDKQVRISYATALPNDNATTMKKGQVYTIVGQGTGTNATDFMKYGSPNNITGTTFVATGGPVGTSNGTVTPYTLVTDTYYPMSSTSGTFLYSSESYPSTGGFNPTWDSPKDGNGNITSKNTRLFIIRVRDSTLLDPALTPTGAPETLDNLIDAVLIKLDIDNVDSKNPSINVLPFGREYTYNPTATSPNNDPANNSSKYDIAVTNYNRNIEMNSATEKGGYVQYQANNINANNNTNDSLYKNANVSGKVKFLGKAEDNQRIKEINVTISGYNSSNKFKIADVIPSTGHLKAADPGILAGGWTFKIDSLEYLTQDYGHTLNWEFMWDSSKHVNVAKNDVTIDFEVVDFANRAVTASTTVNVVPYISDIVTSLSSAYASAPSAFSRSALGGYPVREGEEITIKGFNFGSSSWDVKVGSTSLTGVTSTTGGIKGTVPASASSGELTVTVNSIPSFNNSSFKDKNVDYNQEGNGVNNNRLNNSRYLYVWKVGRLSSDANANMSNPFMRMNYNGDRFISYGYYGTSQSSGALRVQKNNSDLHDIGAAYTNRMINTTVAVGSSNPSFYAMGSDLSSLYNGNRGFQLGRSNAAGTASIDTNRGSGTGDTTSNAFGAIRLFSMYNSISDRFKIPRIAVKSSASPRTDGSSDKVLISFYDEVEHKVQVIYGNIGSNYTNAVNQTVGLGGIESGFRPTSGTEGNAAAVPAMSTSAVTISDTNTHQGSMYTACGFLGNGVPVFAWYDSSNNKLWFSYDRGTVTYPLGTGLTATSRVDISQSRVITNAVPIDTGKGTDVDLAVDDANNVHIAYYDVANGGLWYALIPANGTGNDAVPNTGSITTVRVDTFLTAGTNLMINVRKEGIRNVPYISYYHNSFTKSKNSIRVAWQKNTTLEDGTDNSNMFKGTWEVMTVPAEKTPTVGDFVCNGVPPSSSSNWTQPNSSWPSDIRQSILLGYFTSDYYEGAVLKDNMTTTPTILQK